MNPAEIPFQELLIHRDFLRRLARELVADEAERQDLEQQVWLQALHRPPRERAALRGWLATTARNVLANARRSAARRAAREELAAHAERTPAVDEVLARESVRESVLRAVLALDEPFREALLLRYYEGLPPRDIATRLGLSAATVRSRLARGLERLRARLDVEHGGRQAWLCAVIPWSRAPEPTTTLLGALAVKKALIAAVVLLAGLLAWQLATRGRAGGGALAEPEHVAVLAPAPATASASQDATAQRAARDARRPATADAAAPRPRRVFPAERGLGAVVGRVFDAVDAPAPDVLVRALPHIGGLPPGLVVDDGRAPRGPVQSAADGTFRLTDVEEGPVRVEALFADGARASAVVVVSAGTEAGPLRLARSGAHPDASTFHALAVDPHGRTVAGAQLEAYGWSTAEPDSAAHEAARERPLARAITDADGRAQLAVPRFAHGAVFATTPDGRTGWAAVRHPHGALQPLQVEVAPAGRISGEILGARDEDLAGASLALHALSETEPYYTGGGRRIAVALRGARFVVEGLAAGTYVVTLDSPGGLRLDRPLYRWGEWELPNSIEPATVVVEPERTSELALRVVPGGTLRGHVVSSAHPVPGARVRAVLTPRTGNFPSGFVLHGVHVWRFDGDFENGPHSPVSHPLTTTDAEGRYAFHGLQPGAYRVEVALDGLAFDRRLDVAVADGETVELAHDLAPAGVLQVAALGVSYLGVTPVEVPRPDGTPDGPPRPVMIAVTADDVATFAGLAAGRYVVSRFHSDERVAPVPLGEAQVEAGRTTWIDLRGAALVARLRGVVRAGGAPVGGARVVLGRARAATDAQGAFELRLPHIPRFGPALGTSLAVHVDGAEHRFEPVVDAPSADLALALDLGAEALVVEVIAADGQPSSARAELDWSPSSLARSGPRSASLRARSARGRFAFEALHPGEITGRVTFDDGWTLPVAARIPAPAPLRVVRPEGGRLSVLVERGGRPAADLGLTLVATVDGQPAASARWSNSVRTNADGRVELEAPAGLVTVSLHTAFFFEPPPPESARVEVGGWAEIVVRFDG
ncbi:MAG: sigma-70 family RNA polymerase sigma factor [Planctomycetes bacterium]|nr:sigma-70 family RNA polymerase sigma factor [Planctomycetota bacterium]